MMLKDLRLITRDRVGFIGLLVVPIVVIMVIAAATQTGDGSNSIVFPVVNEDQGPVATALIRAFREHLEVRVVSRSAAHRLVADQNDAPAALILPPELSKRYLAQKPSTVELLTDPAQWQQLEAVKMVMLLADRETASLGDPFSQELLTVRERNITGDHLALSSLEQNIPGFSLMFVLLALIFGVSLALREEEVWNTSGRLSIAPVTSASLLGGKLLARLIVGTAQLLLLLLFGHFAYGLRLGHSPLAIVTVAVVIVASMTCFAAVVAAFVRTREQAIPVGIAVSFVLAALGGLFWPVQDLPRSMQAISHILVTSWSMSALQDVMLRGRGVSGVSLELLVLAAYGLLSFALALRLFHYGDRSVMKSSHLFKASVASAARLATKGLSVLYGRIRVFGLLAGAAMLLSSTSLFGCSAHNPLSLKPYDEAEMASSDLPTSVPATDGSDAVDYDPWESFNERTFSFNFNILDHYALKPVATIWAEVVPHPVRNGLANAFDNLGMPRRFVNKMLQGRLPGAGEELVRFALNTTAGIAGFFDVASHLGLPGSDADTGQTLGVYGISPGPYLVLPVLQPLTVRDAIGYAADSFMDPLSYFVTPFLADLGRGAANTINERAEHMTEYDDVEDTSLDLYAAVRNGFLQRRQKSIKDAISDRNRTWERIDLHFERKPDATLFASRISP